MSSKKKKKYVPKQIVVPKLINALNSFGTFETAVEKILRDGEVELDEAGVFSYLDAKGVRTSIDSTLYIYLRMAEIYMTRKNLVIELGPLWKFREHVMAKNLWMDEEEIEAALACVAVCRKIYLSIPLEESRDILAMVRNALKYGYDPRVDGHHEN